MARFRDRRGATEFQALYELSRGDLLAWIAGQLRSRRLLHDPLDILQDTFVNIYRYAGGFRDERASSFRIWARMIATNAVRRAGATSRRELALEALPKGVEEPADRAALPIEILGRDEDVRSLTGAWTLLLAHYAAAVKGLGQRDRIALELIELSGLSYAQAAARLGVGRSNMKMIVFRARRRLRAAIGMTFHRAGQASLRAAG